MSLILICSRSPLFKDISVIYVLLFKQQIARSGEKTITKTAEASASMKVIQKPESTKEKSVIRVADLGSKPEPIQMPPSFKDPIFGKVFMKPQLS